MTDANWNDKQGESGEKAHKVLKSSVRKNWCKLYAISSLINKDWKLQRFDLHFKTVKGLLGCLITRSKAHTFTWCIALEFSSFFVWICSKHSKRNCFKPTLNRGSTVLPQPPQSWKAALLHALIKSTEVLLFAYTWSGSSLHRWVILQGE